MTLYIYLAVLLGCLVTGFYYFKILSQGLKFLFWFVLITMIVEIIGTYHLEILSVTANWVFRFYQLAEYVLLGGYFLTIIMSPDTKKFIMISIPVVVLINVVNLFLYQQFTSLSIYAFLLAAFLVTVWSVLYFFQLFKLNDENDPAHEPAFWICTGILFFYAGVFFLMGFSNTIYAYNPGLAKKLYIINHLLNCILYGMITYGFICQSKYQKS